MSNKDCSSVHQASKKNMLERVLNSAAHRFLSKSTGAKAKCKILQNTHARTIVAARTPGASMEYTHQSNPCSPPKEFYDVHDALTSEYAADPIFNALDANDLPDLTLSIASEIGLLWSPAPKSVCAIPVDAPKRVCESALSDSSGPGSAEGSVNAPRAIHRRRSQKIRESLQHARRHTNTTTQELTKMRNSVRMHTGSYLPRKPSWSISSSFFSYRQRDPLSSVIFLSAPTHPDQEPRNIKHGLLKKSPGRQVQTKDHAPSKETTREARKQQKADIRHRQAADFENRVRDKVELTERESRRGETKKCNSLLSASLLSTSSSPCSRTPPEKLSPKPPSTSSNSPEPHSFSNLKQQSPPPAAFNITRSSMASPPPTCSDLSSPNIRPTSFPSSQMTPPPTPPFSIQLPSYRFPKTRCAAISRPWIPSVNKTSRNASPAKNASSASRSRLRSGNYEKKESSGEAKLTLTPYFNGGVEGDVGRV